MGLLLLLLPICLRAQQANDTLNFDLNFSRSWRPMIPLQTGASIVTLSRTSMEVAQSTVLYDALGRVVQNIQKRWSPLGKDVANFNVYDSMGSIKNAYLPYVTTTATGDVQNSPLTDQTSFYNSYYSGELAPYTQNVYERSPMGIIQKMMAPGRSWAGTSRGVTGQYAVNAVSDSVRIWIMNGNLPSSSTRYAAGELVEDTRTDENNRKVITYTDRQGHEVLKKVQIAATPGTGHMGWLCTYQVYDDLGNLRFVIPPLAVIKMIGVWNLSPIVNLCSSYQYDQRQRVIVKETPDTDSTEYVYDRKNRPVFFRDGNLRAQNKWQVTFYDRRDRNIMTALYNSASTRVQLQTIMNGASSSQALSYTIPGIEDFATAVNDANLYQAGSSISLLSGFASTDGQTMVAEIVPVSGEVVSITADNPLPSIPTNALIPLAYNFYDDYSFSGVQAPNTADFLKPKAGSDPYPERPTAVSKLTQGMVTGGKIRIIGTDHWLTSTLYYDDKGRVIQSLSENETGGLDVVTSLYNFAGKLIGNYLRHANKRSGFTPTTTISNAMTYNHRGELIKVAKEVNDDGVLKTISQLRYNELGQVKTTVLGSAIDSLEYDYNIRGWLKNINKGYALNGSAEGKNHHFGEQLFYDSIYTPQYTGNLSGNRWRGFNDNAFRSYGFAYDPADRMLKADFTQFTSGSWNTSAGIDFSMKMGDGINADSAYDLNGNILSMFQKGYKPGGSLTLDDLRYTYETNSNRLKGVRDLANNTASTLGDFKEVNGSGDTDYTYDASGNFTSDNNKRITNITYNHLNLPETIKVFGKGTVTYLYDANGRRIKKTVIDSTSNPTRTITTDYIGGFVYQNDSLFYFNQEQGRVRMVYSTGQAPQRTYDYFVQDHLGNTRSVLTEQTNFTMYAATMEPENAPVETATFSNVEETRASKPVGYPETDTSQGSFVAKLNAKSGGKKIGPSIVLRVMAGDTIKIGAKAFFKSDGPVNKDKAVPAEDMILALAQAFGGAGGTDASHGNGQGLGEQSFTSNFYNNNYQQLKQKGPDVEGINKRKSYLNFVMFDDQFQVVEGNSGVRQVKNSPDEIQQLSVDGMVMEKSGFLYVFPSNETAQDVYFDDIVVTDITGPVLEETHYYPYGLVMDGISSRTPLSLENCQLFQGKELQRGEFADGTGLEWYNFEARYYDPQLGRWFSTDPAGQDYSPYMAMGNRPPMVVDRDGRYWQVVLIGGLVGGFLNTLQLAMQGESVSPMQLATAFGIGFVAGAAATLTGGAVYGAMTGVSTGAALSGTGVAVGAGGFVTGFTSNSVAGGVAGIIQGTGNGVALGKMSTGDAIAQGADEGFKGMIFGGLWGGFSNGIIAKINGRNFWTGNMKLYDIDPVVSSTSVFKTYTYDENLARKDLHPDFRLGPSLGGKKIESTYAMTIYDGYTHTPNAPTIDFSNTLEAVSLKSTMAPQLNISDNMRKLATFPQPIKILHVVTPPGHLPQNWGAIRKLADELGIILRHSEY
ncbi:RHS repeat-associated core domain-containing protein [Chitinophaga sp. CF418]|nr:RHS repeat-associated core domain-containing protein [Chitinophaga sp. CF418]